MVTSPSKNLLSPKSKIFLPLSREQSSILLLEERSVGCPFKCILKTNYTVNFQVSYYFLFIAPILLLLPLSVESLSVLSYKQGYASTFHIAHSGFGFPHVLNHLLLIFLLKLCWYSLLSRSFFNAIIPLNILLISLLSQRRVELSVCVQFAMCTPAFLLHFLQSMLAYAPIFV